MLPVFITSNQIPLHVHAVFCQLHVHCIHLARGMMRMRIPSSTVHMVWVLQLNDIIIIAMDVV